ncbi:LamG domain-containing protein [Paenibacillus cymbidii]|uniref:hypothetical protein n=1 Tax=Paenibacillus cymbidii TaxID=1639034 RepID=UPI0010806B2A|nr:hypothetical protein [Paenibacillus cymbidii]
MKRIQWNMTDDLEQFEWEGTGARLEIWDGQEALRLEGFHTVPVLLRESLPFDSFRLQAEVCIPGSEGFIGLAFGARDRENYELVYWWPGTDTEPGEIQYDPIMNGSSTWQIYNGPAYQASAPFPAGRWNTIAIEVHPYRAAIFVGDETVPRLTINQLQHGKANGRIGAWGNFPGYIRNMSVEEIEPSSLPDTEPILRKPVNDSFVTEWEVSEPYNPEEHSEYTGIWRKAVVEENGCLNLNRLYAAESKGNVVQARASFVLADERETTLSCGYSDRIKLWINDREVYTGTTVWDPPQSDGRIRANQASFPVRWNAGRNTIRAEITNLEGMFGWGTVVQTGIADFANE